jgi:methionyl-tRNA synthetase
LTAPIRLPILLAMKKRLVTSALPYVNNIPHLGNLIQVLSADVFARFCRLKGYETLYVCGTDEYGTATETRAREEGVSPKELCDRYYKIHKDIYSWFNIDFSHFGRTSKEAQTKIVQDIFWDVYNAGYINQHTITQLYSEKSQMFLADRYVRGICPNCGYEDARGDQCENCGKLLEPTDLIEPRSIVDNTKPVLKETTHLYLDLPKILPQLQEWMKEASVRGKWAKNAVKMTEAWIRDGLKERAITRDLKWGIPVPLEGFENKVFYVWFDAPIGYISITADLMDNWQDWWQNPEEVELFQFIGKDNIPFHTVIFPSTLLASGKEWTMLHHMSSSEYLNYEDTKFSKSKGIGVFGDDVQNTGIPVDVWRFYIFYNRPETSDYVFTWKDFLEKTNKELIGNQSNLVNRTLTFLTRFFDGKIAPLDMEHEENKKFWNDIKELEHRAEAHYENAELRDAFRTAFQMASLGNKMFQESEPWKLKETNPEEAHRILSILIYLIRDLAILVSPVIPATANKMLGFLGLDEPRWSDLGVTSGLSEIGETEILFTQLDKKKIEQLRDQYSGSQSERQENMNMENQEQNQKKKEPKKQLSKAEKIKLEDQDLTDDQRFQKRVELRVAKIVGIEQHPDAEKLYIEKLDDGSGEERTIVSGLVPHYKADELLNKNIILVANLKPAKLRGVKSHGMLLAASSKTDEGEIVDVIFADDAQPGDQISVEGSEPSGALDRIDIDLFFDIPIKAESGSVKVGDKSLTVSGTILKTKIVENGPVG